MIFVIHFEVEEAAKVLNDSPFLTVGTLLELTKSFGWNCRD